MFQSNVVILILINVNIYIRITWCPQKCGFVFWTKVKENRPPIKFNFRYLPYCFIFVDYKKGLWILYIHTYILYTYTYWVGSRVQIWSDGMQISIYDLSLGKILAPPYLALDCRVMTRGQKWTWVINLLTEHIFRSSKYKISYYSCSCL